MQFRFDEICSLLDFVSYRYDVALRYDVAIDVMWRLDVTFDWMKFGDVSIRFDDSIQRSILVKGG